MRNWAISAGSPMYLAMPIEEKKGASRPEAKASSVLSQSATRACINVSIGQCRQSRRPAAAYDKFAARPSSNVLSDTSLSDANSRSRASPMRASGKLRRGGFLEVASHLLHRAEATRSLGRARLDRAVGEDDEARIPNAEAARRLQLLRLPCGLMRVAFDGGRVRRGRGARARRRLHGGAGWMRIEP